MTKKTKVSVTLTDAEIAVLKHVARMNNCEDTDRFIWALVSCFLKAKYQDPAVREQIVLDAVA
ncbi:MAG: hypothetical protein P8N43_05145 [Alphaproteobacteria bacterium]|nr:hypothetical protein [Alphaproteobacteria bacterium]